MKQSLEKRLEALEQAEEPIKYVVLWPDEPIDPNAEVIRLKWADDP